MRKTRVISISGSGRGVGKTRLAELLLRCLPDCAAIKVQAHAGGKFALLVEDTPGQAPGKDTDRFLAAGARQAFLASGPCERALRAVREIIGSGRFGTVIVESNAAARELESDLSFFVKGPGKAKPGAAACEERADIIVTGLSHDKEEHTCRTNRNVT